VSSSPDPFVFGIPHPPFFCGGSVTGRLVTSCGLARGPKAVPASNERLTLHAVLGALPSYPTTLTRNFSACPSQCPFDTCGALYISFQPLTLNSLLCNQINFAFIASLTCLEKSPEGRISFLVLYIFLARRTVVNPKIPLFQSGPGSLRASFHLVFGSILPTSRSFRRRAFSFNTRSVVVVSSPPL
jgi:hypothetical protein